MDRCRPPAVISAKSQLFAHMRHIGVRERAGKGAEAGRSGFAADAAGDADAAEVEGVADGFLGTPLGHVHHPGLDQVEAVRRVSVIVSRSAGTVRRNGRNLSKTSDMFRRTCSVSRRTARRSAWRSRGPRRAA
ncbi:hypothetical protein Misp03_29150 [Microbispora sp. NBRC 16548]|nr:hypothetical protein Misp03_29150 [Microbispora sp. NBRC 16548]